MFYYRFVLNWNLSHYLAFKHYHLHRLLLLFINMILLFKTCKQKLHESKKHCMNRKNIAMIFVWFARILNILKSSLNRLKIMLNSSAKFISEALCFFTKAVQISKVFSLLICIFTVWFKICICYLLIFIFDELKNTFMFDFDLICTDQHIDWQWDSSVHDVNYESFDSILCSNRSQKS